MSKNLFKRVVPRSLAVIALCLLFPALASAQAWVPDKHEMNLWLSYGSFEAKNHLFSENQQSSPGAPANGNAVDLGHIRSNTAFLGLEYGLSNRIAASAEVAYVRAEYRGAFPEDLSVDDGSYHGSLQDASASVRFQVLRNPLVVTPFVGFGTPTHHYNTFGHTALGGGLRQAFVGVDLGRTLGPVLRNLFVQSNFTYSFVEKVEDISVNRSNWSLGLGYFVNTSVAIRAYGSWMHTYGGLDWAHDITSQSAFEDHDAAAAASWTRVGGAVSWDVSPSVSTFFAYSKTVHGANTHDGAGFTLGTSWTIGGAESRKNQLH